MPGGTGEATVFRACLRCHISWAAIYLGRAMSQPLASLSSLIMYSATSYSRSVVAGADCPDVGCPMTSCLAAGCCRTTTRGPWWRTLSSCASTCALTVGPSLAAVGVGAAVLKWSPGTSIDYIARHSCFHLPCSVSIVSYTHSLPSPPLPFNSHSMNILPSHVHGSQRTKLTRHTPSSAPLPFKARPSRSPTPRHTLSGLSSLSCAAFLPCDAKSFCGSIRYVRVGKSSVAPLH